MDLPHQYHITANATDSDSVILRGDGLPDIRSMPPKMYNGPGDQWSPEDLLVAAVADCFVLAFRVIAAASNFSFKSLRCEATGTLDRVEKTLQFTRFDLNALLVIPEGADSNRGKRLMEKAKQACLITNSLKSDVHLELDVKTE